jgi:hypothetical protein
VPALQALAGQNTASSIPARKNVVPSPVFSGGRLLLLLMRAWAPVGIPPELLLRFDKLQPSKFEIKTFLEGAKPGGYLIQKVVVGAGLIRSDCDNSAAVITVFYIELISVLMTFLLFILSEQGKLLFTLGGCYQSEKFHATGQKSQWKILRQ